MTSKKRFLRVYLCLVLSATLFVSPHQVAKADMFGGDVVILTKILANAIQQLIRLREIVSTARNNLNLVRDINRGLTDVLNLVSTVYPDAQLEIYKNWNNYQQSFNKVEEIYGHIVNSKEALAQGHLDKSVIEAIIMYNKLSKHSKQIDRIGESLKSQSLGASPKGAARLTVQGMGVSLHVQNQSLRTQSALLKLEAQNSAIKNRKDKEETRFFLESAQSLKANMKSYKPKYKTPRF